MYSSTLPLTLVLVVVGGKRQARQIYPRERPSTHCIGGWASPRDGQDGAEYLAPPGFDPK